MSNVLELLKNAIPSGLVDQLAQQNGTAPEQTNNAVDGILGTLVGALSKNASTPEGAEALNNALERDQHQNILGNVMGLFSGNQTDENDRKANGLGILGHVLGDKMGGIVEMLTQSTGLQQGNISDMMVKLAPVVMGVLGQVKSQQNLDANGLSQTLSSTVTQSTNPILNMVSSFLDKDKDGSIMDDLASMGMNMLGNLFKK